MEGWTDSERERLKVALKMIGDEAGRPAPAIAKGQRRSWRRRGIVGGGILAAAVAAAAVLVLPRTLGGVSNEHIVAASGSDRLPSETASDWVTYADYVVVATPTAQKEIPPTKGEVEHGEGLIQRRVSLRVDDVLWSSDAATKPSPKSFSWTAPGWQFTDGSTSKREKMAVADSPRIELGHTYIMAIDWEPARCTPGDFVPAQWQGLGAGSVVPFDDHVIGKGEMEGRTQTVAQALAAPNYGLGDRMAGQSASALVQALRSAKTEPKQQFGPPASETTCGSSPGSESAR